MNMRRIALVLWLGLTGVVYAVSVNFEGHFRAETASYSGLDIGAASPVGDPGKTFIGGRALLEPNLVIDDHFNLKSQWTLLTSAGTGALGSPGAPPANQNLRPGQGGFVFGDPDSVGLFLGRAWLEWTSDFGVMRLGRMPVSWGYGVLYDSGDNIWDDWQTTFDRVEYRLHLGNVIGGIAYSKPLKRSVLGNQSDQDFYSIYLKYDSPESEIEAGILYEKQARASSQQAELLNTLIASGQLDRAPIIGLPPGQRTPYPLSNNVVDVYLKKTLHPFTFGGEVTWIGGDAADFNADGTVDTLSAFAFLVNATYELHKLKVFLDFLYASGDQNVNDGSLQGFVLLHRNRHPGLILGRELMGRLHSNTVGRGSLFAYSSSVNTFSGAYYFRPGLRVDWSQDWSTGLEVIVAQKVAAIGGESKSLGVEIDFGVEHSVYQNCLLGAEAGYLFSGVGLGGTDDVFAVRATFGVDF